MDPGQNNYGADRAVGLAGRATQSYIYQATTVMSNFSKGKFTQELDMYATNLAQFAKQTEPTKQAGREGVKKAPAKTEGKAE